MQQALSAPVYETVNSLQIPKFTARILHSLLCLSQMTAAAIAWTYWRETDQGATSLVYATGAATAYSVAIALNAALIIELIAYSSVNHFRTTCKGAMLANAILGIMALVMLFSLQGTGILTQVLYGSMAIQSLTIMLAQGLILNRQLAEYSGTMVRDGNYLRVRGTTF